MHRRPPVQVGHDLHREHAAAAAAAIHKAQPYQERRQAPARTTSVPSGRSSLTIANLSATSSGGSGRDRSHTKTIVRTKMAAGTTPNCAQDTQGCQSLHAVPTQPQRKPARPSSHLAVLANTTMATMKGTWTSSNSTSAARTVSRRAGQPQCDDLAGSRIARAVVVFCKDG